MLHPNQTRIHIDRQPYHSPQNTTHEALYGLGKVQEGWQLFAEPTDLHREDKPLRKDGSTIQLIEEQHFYSREVRYVIIVNGRERTVFVAVLSFEDIVKLAFPQVPPADVVAFTVTYTRGDGRHKEGQLDAGEVVEITNGMNFNVTKTSRA